LYVIAGCAGLVAAIGCQDTLAVTNGNNPDAARALARPSDVEALIGSSLNTAWRAMNGQNDNVDNQMRVFSFENSSSLANFGFGTRIGIPRKTIYNSKGNPVLVGNFWDYAQDARAPVQPRSTRGDEQTASAWNAGARHSRQGVRVLRDGNGQRQHGARLRFRAV
jgi:hypothetical protein